MRSFLTAVIAAIEAAAVAVVGLLAIAIPVLLLWIVTFDLAAEPAQVAAWTAGVWLLGHLVPLGFEVSAESALGLGLAPEAIAVPLSLAPLAIMIATAVFATRAGWRFGSRGGAGAAGAVGGGIGFAVVAFLTVRIAGDLVVWPDWLAVLVPAAIYALGSLVGFLVRAARDEHDWWEAFLRRTLTGLDRAGVPGAGALRARAADTVRLAVLAATTLLGISALALAAALVVGYARVTELGQSLQLDWLGSILVFLVQLAYLPVALVWAGSWLTGAGFSIGSGTSVTPFETLTGPLPALPLFGAIPQGWGALGALPPALLVLAGIALGAVFVRRSALRRASWPVALAVPALAAILAGCAVAGATALATGAIGPDRLAVTGADPWIVGGLAAGELAIGLLIGVASGRVDAARLRDVVPDEVPGSEALRRISRRVGDRAADIAGGLGVRGTGTSAGAGVAAEPAGGAAEEPAAAADGETVELELDQTALLDGHAEVVPFPTLREARAQESESAVLGGDEEQSLPGGYPDERAADESEAFASEWDGVPASTMPANERPARESFYDQAQGLDQVSGKDPDQDTDETRDTGVDPERADSEHAEGSDFRDELDEEELLRAYAWDGAAAIDAATLQDPSPEAAPEDTHDSAGGTAESGDAEGNGWRRGWRGRRRGR